MSDSPPPPNVPKTATSFDLSQRSEVSRPVVVKHLSAPGQDQHGFQRHHTRKPSAPRAVKETLNARSEYTSSQDDGAAEHHINQYIIKQEIGRGSFGAVHLAKDQYGEEYAVKEFSKSRLRKRAQSNILRRPGLGRRPGQLAAGGAFNSPLHRQSPEDIAKAEEGNNPLHLIKEEIAIMKKLNHPNLVALIEVLDDPTEDSLYMVMEMCKKGVIMKVGLGEVSDPYDGESCRSWFRDLILGIEYLHQQGVVHRDIKPDNCLLTSDDVLKVVDFGVSEMFAKDTEMLTAKSAGSPAFLPPELCVVGHGDVSGKAADIWSMGATLYCLRYGRIPFEKMNIFELFEAIKSDTPACPGEQDEDFKDLISKVLEKDPAKRIKMSELREHSWVTKNGTDPLMTTEENVATLLAFPTQEEVNRAISNNINRMIVVMKAVNKFKKLLDKRRPFIRQSILGSDSRIVQPPISMSPKLRPMRLNNLKTYSEEYFDRALIKDRLLSNEGVSRALDSRLAKKIPGLARLSSTKSNEMSSASASDPHLEIESISEDAESIHKSDQPSSSSQASLPLLPPRPPKESNVDKLRPPSATSAHSVGQSSPISPRSPSQPFQIPRRPVGSPNPSPGIVPLAQASSETLTSVQIPTPAQIPTPVQSPPPSIQIRRRPVPPRSPIPSETAPLPPPASQSSLSLGHTSSPPEWKQEGKRGHAHDPLSEHLFLHIGPSTWAGPSTSGNNEYESENVVDVDSAPIISESPGAADTNIYETAYMEEIERIRRESRETQTASEPDLYLTRHVEGRRLGRIAEFGRLIKEHGRNRLPIFYDHTERSEDDDTYHSRFTRRSRSRHRDGGWSRERGDDESPGLREQFAARAESFTAAAESLTARADEARQVGRAQFKVLRERLSEKKGQFYNGGGSGSGTSTTTP